MLLSLLSTLIQFAIRTGDPQWSCELAHRDVIASGTYYLYCAKTLPSGVEIISVGHFIPDVLVKKAP